ncbi:MAG: phosphatidate cytidylyltransferase, partial [Thermoguttaceae bacterium]|nr:phosphatidate cytidylyltransferase [Thermoguttaceae bacterium]
MGRSGKPDSLCFPSITPWVAPSLLRWRLSLGTLFIAALVGLCWLDHQAAVPGTYLMPLAAALCVLATEETLGLLGAAGMRPIAWLVYAGNLLVVGYAWVGQLALGGAAEASRLGLARGVGVLSIDFAFTLAAVALFLGEMWRFDRPGSAMRNLAAALFAVVYVGLLLSFVVRLRLGWGVGALASLVIVVKMGDTGAYAVGRLLGRHKMAPVLSPGKTVEGAAGAVGFALVGAWMTFRWLVPATASTYHDGACCYTPWWGWMVFGVLVGGVGIVGDLAESLLKRDANRKDSSTWMPGFGGVLDLLDSVLLAAPAAYACWAFG